MLKKFGYFSVVLARIVVVASLSIVFLSHAYSETIKIGGTGSGIGTMKLLGDTFIKVYPQHDVKVLPSLGSSGGIRALTSGALNVAVIARELTNKEKNAELVISNYGTTAFVFASHPKVVPISLTKQKIADIYSGKQGVWLNKQAIRLVLRPRSDVDTNLIHAMSPEISEAVTMAQKKPGMNIAVTDVDSADALEKTAGSFGTSTLALLLSENRRVSVHSIQGVKPTLQTIKNGTYPYVKKMYLVTSAKPSVGTRDFLEFLKSSQGTKILSQTGHAIN